MTTKATIEDERNILFTILGRLSSQHLQLIRSQTTPAHLPRSTSDELQQTLDYIQQRIPKISPETISDFAYKNCEPHDVISIFKLGPQFVAVTIEEFRHLLNDGGWSQLSKRYPGTKGIMDCSRVGFSNDGNQALIYFGHQRAARSGLGSFRLFQRKADGTWRQSHSARAWIS